MLNWAYAPLNLLKIAGEGKSKSMRRLYPLIGVDNISIIRLVAD